MAINGNDLFKRICAGAIYIGITGACTFISWWSCVVCMGVTAAICCHEFLQMAKREGFKPFVLLGTIAAGVIPISMLADTYGVHIIAWPLGVSFVAAVVILLLFVRHIERTGVDVALTIFGFLYCAFPLAAFALIRLHLHGFEGGLMCVLILLSVWMNDVFAYLGGSAFGKHKFAPKISPKKTWEGIIFGMVGSMLFWLLIPLFCPDCGFGYVWAALSGLVCGAVGIMGDLTESRFKRSFNVKDSGNLMPGHGGLLDRSDSLLFVSVVAYLLVVAAPYASAFVGIAL